VIVDNLHVAGVTMVSDETDAVLIIDPNVVLASPVARKRPEPVSGECRQIAELASRMELLRLALAGPSNLLQASAEPAREERPGFGVLERPNHPKMKV